MSGSSLRHESGSGIITDKGRDEMILQPSSCALNVRFDRVHIAIEWRYRMILVAVELR